MMFVALPLLVVMQGAASSHDHDGVKVDLMSTKSDDFQCKSTTIAANKAKTMSVEDSKDIVLPLRVRLSPSLITDPQALLKFKIGNSFPRRTVTIGIQKGMWVSEEQTENFGEDNDFDERTLFVNRRISLFEAQLAGKETFTSLYIRCHSSSTKEHDYSYFTVSTPDNEEDVLITVKFSPAPEDCLGHVTMRLVDKQNSKSFIQLGYECSQPLHTLCSHDQECSEPGSVCKLVREGRAECQCGNHHVEMTDEEGGGCVVNEKNVGSPCTSSYQCEASKAKCRTVEKGQPKVCQCLNGMTVTKNGVCEDPYDRPKKQIELDTLGHPWMPHKFEDVLSVAGLTKQGCQTLLPSKKLEQLPIHWNIQGALVNMWVRLPHQKKINDTSELTVHFLHTDAQHDDVRPVFKVGIVFGDGGSNKKKPSVLLTGSENHQLGKVEVPPPASLGSLPGEEFSSVKLALDCDSTLTCGFTLEQEHRQVFRQHIGSFDLMFQPNIFTLSAPEEDDIEVKLGCQLGNLEECMDDVECTGNLKCWSSQQLWPMGGALLGKLINGVNSAQYQLGPRINKTCVCQSGLKWNGHWCQ